MKLFERHIVALVCLFCVNAWAAWHQELATPKKVDGVYQIGTPEELAGFAQLTNGSEPDAKGILTADLVFGDDIDSYSCESVVVGQWPACSKFNSIGQEPSKPFTGTLDGNGHIIYGLFGYGDMMALGLIGTLGEDGVVKNLTLVKPMFANPRSYAGDNNYFSLGGVVGTNYGTVLNCHVIDASIDVPFTGNYYHSATGGVVGINGDENHQKAKVLNCSSSGTIVGRYVGGVVGWNNYGLVSGSYSTATVIGKTEGEENAEEHTLDSTYAGGIVGYNATNAVLEYSVYYGGEIRLTDDGWMGSLIGNGGEGSVVDKSYYEDPSGPGAGNCVAGPTTCNFDGTDIETLQDEDKQALIDTLNKTANENCDANGGSDCDVPAWNVNDGKIVSVDAEEAQNTADGYITLQIGNDITKASVTVSGEKNGIAVTGGTAFDKNTEITVTLTLLNGAVFQKWTNVLGDSISNANPYTFTISSSTYLKTNFTEDPQTETIIAQYGENATDTIEVVVPVSADSAARVDAVNDAFENHSPAIPDPQKTDGSDDSTYTFAGFVPDEDGVYKPTFTAELKTETVVVKYGDGVDDQIEVAVPQSADNNARTAIVEDTLENHSPKITPSKTETSEYKYEFDHWSIEGNTFTAEFTAVPKNDTLVAQYGENATDTILVVVPVETDSVNRVAAVNDAFENHDPAIESPQKTNGSDDSTYTFAGFVPDEDGVYQPTFEAEVKTEIMVIAYGDGEDERIDVVVPVTYDANDRIDAIDSALKAHTPPIEVKKTNGSEDSSYTFTGFEPDENGVYKPTFTAELKTETVVVQYGENASDTIEVVVPVSADSAARVAAVNDAFENHDPAIESPQKTNGSDDSTYTFAGFVPDEDGVYQPTFEAEVKTEIMVIAYGDGEDERIDVVVPVTYDANDRLDAIDSALAAQNPPVEVKKTNGSDDSTYTYIGWQTKIDKDSNVVVDENGNPVYEPMFEATVKTTELVVVYGADPEKDVVRIPVPVTLRDSAARVQLVIDSLAAWKITPTKTDEDSTYIFDKWNVDGNTFTAEFKSTVKTIELVVVYGADPAKDSIHVIVHVPDNDSVRLEKVKAAIETAGIVPMKAEDADSTYTFNGKWAKTTDGFCAEFDGKAKFIKVVVGDDTVKVVIPEDPSSDSGDGDEVVVEIKVVVDDDTIKVPVSEGDILDSAVNKALDSIPTKDDTADSTYEFAGWKPITDDSGEPIVDENGNPVYEPVFEADVKKETIIASTGDDKGGSIKVIIKVTDTDAEIQDAIKKAFEDNDISLPSKERENEKVYTFEKFVYNRDSGIFEPKFEQHIMFDIAFVLPEKGKLVENIEGYVYGEKTVLPDAIIMDEDGWEFKGWFTKRDGLGTRVKMMLETDVGNKTFYPLFQKTISYNSNGKKGTIEVIYSENAEKNILRALDRVIPEDYSKKNVNYTFDKWVLENGTYVAKFVEGQGIHSNVQMNFYVNVFDHTLEISGVNSGSEICVFDVRGRLVQSAVVSIGSLRMILPNSGRYFVRVSDRIVPVIVR